MAVTEKTVGRTVEDYLALPYRIELIPSEEGGYVVTMPELPGCISQGDTLDEAIEMIRDAQLGWLTVALEDGDNVPLPTPIGAYSSEFDVRVPRDLRRPLVEAADAADISLDFFVAATLARAVGQPMPASTSTSSSAS